VRTRATRRKSSKHFPLLFFFFFFSRCYVFGYFKAGSNQSLIAGGGEALVLCYVYLTLPARPFLASAIGLGQCLISPLTWVSMFVSTDVQLRKIYAMLFIKQFGAVLRDWQFDSLRRIITRKECAWDITSTGNSRTLDMGLRNDTLFQPDGDTLQIQKSMLTLIYIYRERENGFFSFLRKFDFMEVCSCWRRSLNYAFGCHGLSILEFREVFSCRRCVSDNGSWLHPCIDTDIPWLMENSRHEKLTPGVLPKTI